ncbi:hypothetical protein C6382_23700 [Pseudomonas sp. BBP2017]|nr:hypothetical protein C6382_23700 [Pseudomonas sp. BBP2017]
MKIKIKSESEIKIKIKINSESLLALQAGLSREGVSLPPPTFDFEDTSVQASPVTSRLQEAERRCLEGAGAQHPSALAEVARRRLGEASRRPRCPWRAP